MNLKQTMPMKTFYPLLLFLLCALFPNPLPAQIFRIDPLFTDSVKVARVVKAESGWEEYKPYTTINLPAAYEFDLIKKEGGYLIFEKDRVNYRIHQTEVIFSEKNPDEVVNPLPENVIRRHSALSHFFAGLTPYMIILLLIVCGTLIGLLGQRNNTLRSLALKALPVCLAAASALELVAFLTLGSDMIWWCDDDLQGFWGALLSAIPFTIPILMQYYSIRLYNDLLFNHEKDEYGNEKKISLKPVAWGIGLLFPLIILFVLLFRMIGLRGEVLEIGSALLGLGISLFLILKGCKNNIQTFGRQKGILISVFSIIYLLGLIIAGVMLVMVIVSIIVQILITIAAVVGAFYLLSKQSSESSSSPQPTFYAKDGSRHLYSSQAEARNRQIDSKKE